MYSFELAYPHVKAIQDEICKEEKQTCRSYLQLCQMVFSTLRGILVKTDSFNIVENHFGKETSVCRKQDDVMEGELYKGMTKSVKDMLADKCYKQAQNDGW